MIMLTIIITSTIMNNKNFYIRCTYSPLQKGLSEHHHMMTVQSLVTRGCEAKRLHSIAMEDPTCAQLCLPPATTAVGQTNYTVH